jgi:hypothetical protein
MLPVVLQLTNIIICRPEQQILGLKKKLWKLLCFQSWAYWDFSCSIPSRLDHLARLLEADPMGLFDLVVMQRTYSIFATPL